MSGPGADHQPGRFGEVHRSGHEGSALRRRQRQFGEPAARREETSVHPLARPEAGPGISHFDDASDFPTRDEQQGDPRETAAEKSGVPQADARAVDSYQACPAAGTGSGRSPSSTLSIPPRSSASATRMAQLTSSVLLC